MMNGSAWQVDVKNDDAAPRAQVTVSPDGQIRLYVVVEELSPLEADQLAEALVLAAHKSRQIYRQGGAPS